MWMCVFRRESEETDVENHQHPKLGVIDWVMAHSYIEEIGDVLVIVAFLLLVRDVDSNEVCVLQHSLVSLRFVTAPPTSNVHLSITTQIHGTLS